MEKRNFLICTCCGFEKQALTNMGKKKDSSLVEFWCRKCQLEKKRHDEIMSELKGIGAVLILLGFVILIFVMVITANQ